MWFFVLLAALIVGFILLDGAVSRPDPGGCLKVLYLGIGGLLVAALAFVALICFTYPLRH